MPWGRRGRRRLLPVSQGPQEEFRLSLMWIGQKGLAKALPKKQDPHVKAERELSAMVVIIAVR